MANEGQTGAIVAIKMFSENEVLNKSNFCKQNRQNLLKKQKLKNDKNLRKQKKRRENRRYIKIKQCF